MRGQVWRAWHGHGWSRAVTVRGSFHRKEPPSKPSPCNEGASVAGMARAWSRAVTVSGMPPGDGGGKYQCISYVHAQAHAHSRGHGVAWACVTWLLLARHLAVATLGRTDLRAEVHDARVMVAACTLDMLSLARHLAIVTLGRTCVLRYMTQE